MKSITTCKLLENKYGGKWRYNRSARFWEDDLNRTAQYVCMCGNFDDECNCGGVLYLYGNGTPEMVKWNKLEQLEDI